MMIREKIRNIMSIIIFSYLTYQLIFHVGAFLIYHDEISKNKEAVKYVVAHIQIPPGSTDVDQFGFNKMLYNTYLVSFINTSPDAQIRQELRETIQRQGFYVIYSNTEKIVMARDKDKVRCNIFKYKVNKNIRWGIDVFIKDWPIGEDK